MRTNRLSVQIIRPVSQLFEFTIDPKNTPKWIDSIVKQETNEWPVKVGSVYKNQDKEGKWSEYDVTELETNTKFMLTSRDGNYHVRYCYTPINEGRSELEYFEWVDDGDIPNPFKQEDLNKLRYYLEVNT